MKAFSNHWTIRKVTDVGPGRAGAEPYGDVLWPDQMSAMPQKNATRNSFQIKDFRPVGDGMWPEHDRVRTLKSDA